MNAAFFSPYIDTMGGGERYLFTIIEYFLSKGYSTELAWNDSNLAKSVKLRFGLDISKTIINQDLYRIFSGRKSIFEKRGHLKNYDLFFFVSDGSIPFLFSKKNYILFQVPFRKSDCSRINRSLKFSRISASLCYSNFVKSVIDKTYGINASVLYPPAENEFISGSKKNIILSVGRFDSPLNSKKQDIMIETFKDITDKKLLPGWELVLAGGAAENCDIVKKLNFLAKGYPVTITSNISFDKLKKSYAGAKIYWHAAGFGEDLNLHPEKAEHFGISVLEAMSSGCVPVVFNGGGLPEIVNNGHNGWTFRTTEELMQLTEKTAKDAGLTDKLKNAAITDARKFSKKHFYENLTKLIGN